MDDRNELALNEASRTSSPLQDHRQCQACMESWLFHMRDMEHDFVIGLTTIVECLAEAEQRGAIPPLPAGWWQDARRILNM